MKMAFQGARKYPKECQRARLDIDKRVKNAVAEWKSRKETDMNIKEKSMKNAYELAEIILKSRPDKNGELKSSDSFASIELYGTSACKKVQDTEFCECFHLENESGTGMITLYHVFPGIDLVYNDMHMEYCNKEQKPASSVMEINYCMEGRCECVFEQNEYGYIAAGDLSFLFF